MTKQPPDERAIFGIARRLDSPEARNEYLRQVCGNDSHLMNRVTTLLRECEHAESFLESPAVGNVATLDVPITETVGTLIGRYKLLQEVGEGGFGVVYMAEQREPVRRKVALKIIKPGMDTRQVVARFEAERQALALMDHPNVAHVLDGGATESGRPYFVMELVRGMPITQYCDEAKLTTDDRLRLFISVCDAVQHAHQKGIIHRDIKPSNVLVTLHGETPVPKIIDFGVAKATHQQLTEKTVFTGVGQMIGTPLYMSPEQLALSGLDVDTRSDIYSLGVLLYELLTGVPPFDQDRIRELSVDEIRRKIREEEPPRPSTRISTLAAEAMSTISTTRKTDFGRLRHSLRGELDWIVMKAMEKDRSRRYESASELAKDLQRHLDDEPVEACPPSIIYRVCKYARRHMAQLVAVATIATLLVVATAVSSSLAAWAFRAEGEARDNLERSRRSEAIAQRDRAAALDAKALAEQAERLARRQEQLAKKQRDAAEYASYTSAIGLAFYDWATGRTGRMLDLLNSQYPAPGRPDYRGWEWYYMSSQSHREQCNIPFQRVFRITVEDVPLQNLAWSPDGESLATADPVGLVNIWDMASGIRKTSLKGCPGSIRSISWSPNGRDLAAASDRGRVVIWDVVSGKQVQSLRGHAAAARCVDWNPDGVRLASGGDDGAIRIWNAHTGEELSSLTAKFACVWFLDWHPDGRQLLGVHGYHHYSAGSRLKIWDSENASEIVAWDFAPMCEAAFSPDGSHIVWGVNPVRVTCLETQQVVSSFSEYGAHRSRWSPSGDKLASTLPNGTITIWGAKTGLGVSSILAQTQLGQQVTWSPSGRFLASESWDGAIKVWDTNAEQKTVTLSAAGSLAFSPSGYHLLVAGGKDAWKIYDIRSGESTLSIPSTGNSHWLGNVAWSPGGSRFATPVADKVMIYGAQTGKHLSTLQCENSVGPVAWSPDGETLAVAPVGRPISLFDPRTGQRVAVSDDALRCKSLAWRPDGKQLAGAANSIHLWDSALREETVVVSDEVATYWCLDWSPDGQHLATGGTGGTIRIYDATSWDPIHSLEGHQNLITGVRWHPHMARLASGGQDGAIRIWDTTTGRELCELAMGVQPGRPDWSSDGLRLAAACGDGVVRIWDASAADRIAKKHGGLREKASRLCTEKKYEEAIDLLEQLRTLHPEEEELNTQTKRLHWLQATELARDGRVGEAVAIYKRLSSETPDLPDYRLRLTETLVDEGKLDEAIEFLQKSIAELPEIQEYRDELADLRATLAHSHVSEGYRLWLNEGKSDDAVVRFSEAIKIYRDLVTEFPEAVSHQIDLAVACKARGKATGSIQDLTEAITLSRKPIESPHNPRAHQYGWLPSEIVARTLSWRAHLLLTEDKFDEAIADCTEAIRSNPAYAEAYRHRANTYRIQGEVEKAIADYREAIRINAKDAHANRELSELLDKAKDNQDPNPEEKHDPPNN